ncbi:MAG: protease HtpX [Elusimicrobiota bacterium]|nr:MAG: protease HtpX [Elusimicrobiota bacterium]
MTWFKRVSLFLLVNILVMATISIVLSMLGAGRYMGPYGLDYGSLAVFCLVWGMAGSLISLGLSRVMAKWTMGVRLLDPNGNDPLVASVRELAARAGLPMPEVGVYDSPELNAFATGPSRSRALVAVSTGLLESMDRDELEGVLAHELAHIANGDMVTMTLLQGVINAFVMFLARVIAFAMARGDRDERRGGSYMTVWLLEMALGFLGMLVIAAFSRWREFRADAGSARLGGREKMIAALRALQARYAPVEEQPAYAAFKIAGRTGGLMALLSTHPPLEDRIAALRAS